ncbi:uncharacterized protein [Physcomitrium patens]|nr:polyadenylate-binding protein-interacting protein 4-like isoform X2 [Physcomitrium patens]|eukprot:XP_024384480.1 polyadenylate-binding protein-interacting protein 4-like isoform X2 [Physcomitrella patens]
MNHPQSSQKPLQNGGGRRGRIDKDVVSRSDNLNWRQPARSTSNSYSNSNSSTQGGSKGAHDRLVYMYTCLIGQHVEVQKIDGHVYSGIFHTGVFDKDFGVIVKMARLVKEGALSTEGELVREAARKPPIKKLQIQGKDFVQIIAKDVSLTGDASSSNRSRENRSEIVTDSAVSQGWHRESERELKPWKPDDESSDTTNFSLSNTWSGGNWDQFEANKALFGVETTFDEELYTTKLIRGPQMHEREREAQRIAREIQGQQTRNMHLAEERGIHLAPELDALDEEARYSAVRRGYPDEGDDDEDQRIDDHNDETFGGTVTTVGITTSQNSSSSSTAIPGQVYSEESSTLPAEPQIVSGSSRSENSRELQDQPLEKEDSGSSDIFPEKLRLRKLSLLNCGEKSKHSSKGSGSPYNSPMARGSPLMSPLVGDQSGIKALNLDPSCPQVSADVIREFQEYKQLKYMEQVKAQFETYKELEPRSPGAAAKGPAGDTPKESNVQPASHDLKSHLAPMSAAVQRSTHVSAPPPSSLPLPTSLSSSEKPGLVCTIPSRNAASVSPFSAQTSRPFSSSQTQTTSTPNSPSSSTSSLSAASSSKKSPLNAHAKEFKLNPNAKAFTPSTPSARPTVSQQHPVVVQSPVYSMHSAVPAATSIPGSHVNLQNITQHNQFPPYNHVVPSPVVASNPTSYMQPWVPGFPVGVGGGGILPGQPNMRVPHSQQQAMPSYGHPQQLKFPMQPSSSPMQPGLLHPNGQVYPPHMMYAQPSNQVVFVPYPH